MTHARTTHRLAATALAALAVGMATGRAQVDTTTVSTVAIAPATAANPRNSESDIIQLKDGRLLLGWTEFYAGNGADDGAARLVGRVSADRGLTWGEKYTLVENDGKCNVAEVNFLRLKSGHLALFHFQKNVEVSATTTGDCRAMLRVSQDEGKTWSHLRDLEQATDNAFAYPAVTWVDERALVTYFDYKSGISLFLKTIPVAWFYTP